MSWILNDPPPKFGAELAECQIYYNLIPIYSRFRAAYVLPNSIDFIVPTSETMRILPALSDGFGVYTISGNPVPGFTFVCPIFGPGFIMVRAIKNGHGLSDATLYANAAVSVSSDL